jgi:hypothetical protein
MMQRAPIEERLREAGLPEPAPDLRGPVLAAARSHARSGVTWADRVWFSRRWRLAAVALFLALAVLDRVPTVSGVPGDQRPGTAAAETARAAQEAARQAGLPPDQADALARRVLIAASRPAPRSEPSIDELIEEHR